MKRVYFDNRDLGPLSLLDGEPPNSLYSQIDFDHRGEIAIWRSIDEITDPIGEALDDTVWLELRGA